MNIIDKILGRPERESDMEVIARLAGEKCRLNRLVEYEKETQHRIFRDAAKMIGIFSPEKQMEFYEKWEKELSRQIPKELVW